jgi:hypothetical protein
LFELLVDFCSIHSIIFVVGVGLAYCVRHLKHLLTCFNISIYRNYLLGDTLEQRLFEAVNAAFVEIDKVSGQFDPGQYINFIVTNILTSMCFGEK